MPMMIIGEEPQSYPSYRDIADVSAEGSKPLTPPELHCSGKLGGA